MPITVAVTGGIACGKSHLLSHLSKSPGIQCDVFSCDEAVSKLLTEAEIVGRLKDCIGSSVLEADGKINRSVLRTVIFENPLIRKQVEDILHPAVLERAETFLKISKGELLLIEVPLLYEVDFPIFRDSDLVIGCSEKTQLARLTGIRGMERGLAEKILSAQLPIQEKINRSNYVIWNDGSMEAFNDQIKSLSEIFTSNRSST